MSMPLLFGVGLPTAVAFVITFRCLQPRGPRCLLAAGLAAGIGTAVAAAGFCAWRFVAPVQEVSAFPWGEGVALCLLGLTVLALFRSTPRALGPWWSIEARYVACAAVVMGALSLVCFILQSSHMPHGEWDAWAIWNLKARFLFRGQAHWRDLFSETLPHPGYPLLVPSAVARLWTWAGHETPLAAVLVAGTFTYATPLVVSGSLAYLSGPPAAAWGGLLTMAAAPVTVYGVWQVADVPFGFFVLAAVVLVAVAATSDRQWRLALLAGTAVGLAGLVKNEGQPFMVGMTAAYVAYSLVQRHSSVTVRVVNITAFLGAALPFWALLALIQDASPAVGFASALADSSVVSKVTDTSRHALIARSLLAQVWGWPGVTFIGAVPLFAAALWVGGTRSTPLADAPVWFGVAALATMLASYYLAYLVSPYDLAWHISSSLHRILVHLWPTFVWVFCLLVRFDSARPVRTAASDG